MGYNLNKGARVFLLTLVIGAILMAGFTYLFPKTSVKQALIVIVVTAIFIAYGIDSALERRKKSNE